MLQEGFQDVYQLDGGILRYFEECGGSHYQGSALCLINGCQWTVNYKKHK